MRRIPGAPFDATISRPKQSADKSGHVAWFVKNGSASGLRTVTVTCTQSGKKGILYFSWVTT